MTNLVAIVYISLVTNYSELLHPSGNEKRCVTIITEEHRISYEWQGKMLAVSTNLTSSSNQVIKVWAEVKEKQPREPLNQKDGPPPFPK